MPHANEERPAKTLVFVRDDDVGVRCDPLRPFVAYFTQAGIPVNYQVLPAKLDDEVADFMRGSRHDHPGLVELNQHGYRHEQWIRGRHTWSEFADHRSLDDQRETIARGREILVDMLADDFGPSVFTPPRHKFDRNTLRAMEDLGFKVLSAASYPSKAVQLYYHTGRVFDRVNFLGRRVSYHCHTIPGQRLVEISVNIDVDMAKSALGKQRVRDKDDLLRDFRRCRRLHPVVGIMFHHQTYEDESKFKTLAAFMDELKRDDTLEFKTIEAIHAILTAREDAPA